jgi:ATP-binding cassette subfamily B protein RaxB
MFGLENIFIVYLAAQLVTQNLFSIGMLYAFMSYKGKFINATDSLINKWLEFKLLRVHLDRLADIVFTDGEFTKDINTEVNNRVESLSSRVDSCYHLSTRSLGFRYHQSEATVFKDLDLNVPRGKTLVITGQSGCGKSSLLLCLMGLNSAYEGKIYINGNELTPHNRHQQGFAAVLQDDQLLSGSVLDNITDFCTVTELSLVIEVANACCLHQDIMQMTMQYNTLIGDMGSTLSGGQKQRLLLARALYKKPKLLFLDEATSHLDAVMEMNINNNIAKLNMTKIVIAHRQETIASADIVLALNQGVLSDISQTITPSSLKQKASI